jgi:hypothetical protein
MLTNRSPRAVSPLVCGLALLLSVAALAWSQATTVNLTGRVSDPSGGQISGAQVVARNEATGEVSKTVSAADGTFSIALLPGSYTVSASAPGFGGFSRQHVSVAPGEASSFNATLSRAVSARPPVPVETAPSPPPPPPPPPPPAAEADSAMSADEPAGDHSISGRCFLSASDNEETGYGLYSYLLFSSAPASDNEKQRDLAVIKAFLDLLSDVGDLEHSGATKGDLNVTYLLVAEHPQDRLPTSDWVLDHYDFPRAKVLLRRFGRSGQSGPYVASALAPMSRTRTVPAHYLWQDMSHVPGTLAADWEKEFERRAARKDFWASDTRNQALLGLRDFISNGASGLTEVRTASGDFKSMLAEWVTWK